MKSSTPSQSATSLPRAPRDEEGARSRRYLITMGIRIACFVLMVAVTPYGWYTWIFGAAAVVIPYFAVIIANVGSDVHEVDAESPERALTAAAAPAAHQNAPTATSSPTADPQIIRIQESPPADAARGDDRQ